MELELIVRKSKIQGKGLFAGEAIAEGQLLGICKAKKTREDGSHVLTLGSGEQVKVTCKLKYINHSATPNVAYYDDLTVVALQDIAPGEELTHDYGEDWNC